MKKVDNENINLPHIHYFILTQLVLCLTYCAYIMFLMQHIAPIIAHLETALQVSLYRRFTNNEQTESPRYDAPDTPLDHILLSPSHYHTHALALTYPIVHFLMAGGWITSGILSLYHRDPASTAFTCDIHYEAEHGFSGSYNCITKQHNLAQFLGIFNVTMCLVISSFHVCHVMCYTNICCCQPNAWWRLLDHHKLITYLPMTSHFSLLALAISFMNENRIRPTFNSNAMPIVMEPSTQQHARVEPDASNNRISMLSNQSNDTVFPMCTRVRTYAINSDINESQI